MESGRNFCKLRFRRGRGSGNLLAANHVSLIVEEACRPHYGSGARLFLNFELTPDPKHIHFQSINGVALGGDGLDRTIGSAVESRACARLSVDTWKE